MTTDQRGNAGGSGDRTEERQSICLAMVEPDKGDLGIMGAGDG
jgi:hypothetical protein